MPVVKSPIFQCPVKAAVKVLPKEKPLRDVVLVHKTKEKSEKK
jgi:hypothetical protein